MLPITKILRRNKNIKYEKDDRQASGTAVLVRQLGELVYIYIIGWKRML